MIAFVTEPAHPDITPDDQRAAAALLRRGHPVRGVPWDADTDWAQFDSVVVRSPWDYHQRPSDFLAWLDRLERSGARVWNPTPLLRWNSNKRYLLDLAARGVPIVPTTLLTRDTPADLAAVLAARSGSEFVIKPAFAAGAIDTWVTSPRLATEHQPRLTSLLARSDVLVQPFVDEVRTRGEWSLIFFDNAFSHAVLKRPRPGDFRVQEKHGGSAEPVPTPPATLIDHARKVLAAASPDPLLYARVDGVEINSTFTLMELEALEPALFLSTSPGAGDRLANALLARL
jgi:glutathione synthase/RimK-type ligase-like ATP-grasp enzyme